MIPLSYLEREDKLLDEFKDVLRKLQQGTENQDDDPKEP